MRSWWSWGRLWDGLAIVAILFVVWKLLIAPRSLPIGRAYPAPPVAFQKLAGGTFRIPQERGRPLVFDFYASWCQPCKIELPLVEAWARAHPRTAVVPVDVGEPRAVVAAFAAAHRLANVVYDPAGDAQHMFGIEGFPTVVVIDPQGRVRATWTGLNPAIGVALSHAEGTLAQR